MEDDAAHAGQLHATGLQRDSGRWDRIARPLRDLLADLLRRHRRNAPWANGRAGRARPASVAAAALGTIQVAGHEMAGEALQVDLLDRVAVAVDAAVDRRRGRAFGSGIGHSPVATSNCRRSRSARWAHASSRLARREGEIAVEVHQRAEPPVVGSWPGGNTRGAAASAAEIASSVSQAAAKYPLFRGRKEVAFHRSVPASCPRVGYQNTASLSPSTRCGAPLLKQSPWPNRLAGGGGVTAGLVRAVSSRNHCLQRAIVGCVRPARPCPGHVTRSEPWIRSGTDGHL